MHHADGLPALFAALDPILPGQARRIMEEMCFLFESDAVLLKVRDAFSGIIFLRPEPGRPQHHHDPATAQVCGASVKGEPICSRNNPDHGICDTGVLTVTGDMDSSS